MVMAMTMIYRFEDVNVSILGVYQFNLYARF